MNFADAIRHASREIHSGPEFQSSPFLIPSESYPTPPVAQAPVTTEAKAQEACAPVADEVVAENPPAPVVHKAKASAKAIDHEPKASNEPLKETQVRLEMNLTPAQLSALFHSVSIGQHSVLTSREAAGHLRVTVQVVESMANSGQIPAFLVDGKWRFAKSALDEWVALQSAKEAS